jgi:hypothetical protein
MMMMQVLVTSFMNLKKFSKTEIFFSKNSDPLPLNSAKNANPISEISKKGKFHKKQHLITIGNDKCIIYSKRG